MEQYERTTDYKEHELHVCCIRERNGWTVDAIEVKRSGATMFASMSDPFILYQTYRAAELAGFDSARLYVDRLLRQTTGNA